MSQRLLSIDVEAALEKISLGRLRSDDQIPLALARAAAAAGPSLLQMRLKRNRLEIDHDGNPPDARAFELLRVLLDRREDDLVRHRALEELEQLGLLDLLVAFSARARSVLLLAGPPTHLRLYARPGASVVVAENDAPQPLSLLISGIKGRPEAQSEELTRHLRFANFRVEVNGSRLDRGLHLDETLIERSFEWNGIRGLVGLPRQGLAARIRVVVAGVLEEEIWDSPSSGAVWDAVIHCRAKEDKDSVREMIAREAAILYREVPGHFERLDSPSRLRIKSLLFRLADGGSGAEAVSGVRLFRTTGGERVTADTLKTTALGRLIRAIGPDGSAAKYDLEGIVFVLDDRERAFVESHLGLVVREPPRRPTPRGRLGGWVSRELERFRRAIRDFAGWTTARREVPVDRLQPEERTFLQTLAAVTQTGLVPGVRLEGAAFVRGGLAGWRWQEGSGGGDRLVLGRANRQVKSMIRAVAATPAAIYPALMLLADGRDAFGPKRTKAATELAGLTDPGRDPTLDTDDLETDPRQGTGG